MASKASAREDEKRTKEAAQKLHKSCGRCRLSKKKCDGGNPCRRCLETGETCRYSNRRTRTVRARAPGCVSGSPASDSSAEWPTTVQARQSASGLLQEYGRLSLKRCKPDDFSTTGLPGLLENVIRCRLRASSATGLVGMQESTFLADYFACIGYMPFTTQSNIRQTLVKMFAANSAGSVQLSVSGDCSLTEQHRGTVVPSESQLPVGPSTCVFWSAVALGALVKGRPIESVARYARLARDALAKISGPANTDVARAWTILAYMSDFSGDNDDFQVYLQRADDALGDIGEEDTQALPVGFVDLVKHGATIKKFNGDPDRDGVGPSSMRERAVSQTTPAITQGDIGRVVRQAQRETERVICKEIAKMKPTSTPRQCMRNGGACIDSAAADAAGADTFTTSSQGGIDAPTQEQGVASCPSSSLEAIKAKLGEHGRNFERLENDVNRCNLSEGTLGLMINGSIAVGKACRKDTNGILDRLGQWAEGVVRYPGLCRSTMGFHGAHLLAIYLVVIDGPIAQGMYDEVREAYNSALRPGSQAIPPFGEWRGVSAFCDHFYCGLMESIIKDSVVLPPPPLQEHVAERCEKEKIHALTHERGQGVLTSAKDTREAADGKPAQARNRTTIVRSLDRTPERCSADKFVGCMENTTTPEEHLLWQTYDQHPTEHQTFVTSLYPSTLSGTTADSDIDRIAGEHFKGKRSTEPVTRAEGSFSSSELYTLGDILDDTDSEGIEAEDWLDVTQAMLATGGSELDLE